MCVNLGRHKTLSVGGQGGKEARARKPRQGKGGGERREREREKKQGTEKREGREGGEERRKGGRVEVCQRNVKLRIW